MLLPESLRPVLTGLLVDALAPTHPGIEPRYHPTPSPGWCDDEIKIHDAHGTLLPVAVQIGNGYLAVNRYLYDDTGRLRGAEMIRLFAPVAVPDAAASVAPPDAMEAATTDDAPPGDATTGPDATEVAQTGGAADDAGELVDPPALVPGEPIVDRFGATIRRKPLDPTAFPEVAACVREALEANRLAAAA